MFVSRCFVWSQYASWLCSGQGISNQPTLARPPNPAGWRSTYRGWDRYGLERQQLPGRLAAEGRHDQELAGHWLGCGTEDRIAPAMCRGLGLSGDHEAFDIEHIAPICQEFEWEVVFGVVSLFGHGLPLATHISKGS